MVRPAGSFVGEEKVLRLNHVPVEKEIPMFDGSGDAYWWLLRVEQYFGTKGIPEERWLSEVVKDAVIGRALIWWRWWSTKNPDAKWMKFNMALLWQFKPEYRDVLPLTEGGEEPEVLEIVEEDSAVMMNPFEESDLVMSSPVNGDLAAEKKKGEPGEEGLVEINHVSRGPSKKPPPQQLGSKSARLCGSSHDGGRNASWGTNDYAGVGGGSSGGCGGGSGGCGGDGRCEGGGDDVLVVSTTDGEKVSPSFAPEPDASMEEGDSPAAAAAALFGVSQSEIGFPWPLAAENGNGKGEENEIEERAKMGLQKIGHLFDLMGLAQFNESKCYKFKIELMCQAQCSEKKENVVENRGNLTLRKGPLLKAKLTIPFATSPHNEFVWSLFYTGLGEGSASCYIYPQTKRLYFLEQNYAKGYFPLVGFVSEHQHTVWSSSFSTVDVLASATVKDGTKVVRTKRQVALNNSSEGIGTIETSHNLRLLKHAAVMEGNSALEFAPRHMVMKDKCYLDHMIGNTPKAAANKGEPVHASTLNYLLYLVHDRGETQKIQLLDLDESVLKMLGILNYDNGVLKRLESYERKLVEKEFFTQYLRELISKKKSSITPSTSDEGCRLYLVLKEVKFQQWMPFSSKVCDVLTEEDRGLQMRFNPPYSIQFRVMATLMDELIAKEIGYEFQTFEAIDLATILKSHMSVSLSSMLVLDVSIEECQWDPGGHAYTSCVSTSSCFKQWDPGGHLFSKHLKNSPSMFSDHSLEDKAEVKEAALIGPECY